MSEQLSKYIEDLLNCSNSRQFSNRLSRLVKQVNVLAEAKNERYQITTKDLMDAADRQRLAIDDLLKELDLSEDTLRHLKNKLTVHRFFRQISDKNAVLGSLILSFWTYAQPIDREIKAVTGKYSFDVWYRQLGLLHITYKTLMCMSFVARTVNIGIYSNVVDTIRQENSKSLLTLPNDEKSNVIKSLYRALSERQERIIRSHLTLLGGNSN